MGKLVSMKKTLLQKIFIITSDLLSMAVAFLVAIVITKLYHDQPIDSSIVGFFNPGVSKFLGLFVILIFWYQEHYIKRRPFWEEMLQVIKIISLVLVVNLSIAFILGKGSLKVLLVGFWCTYVIVLPLGRLLTKSLLLKLNLWQRTLYIIGYDKNALHAYLLFARNKFMGYKLEAFVDAFNHAKVQFGHLPASMISETELLNRVKRDNNCDVIVALNSQELNQKMRFISFLQHNCLSLLILPDISGLSLYGAQVEHFFGNDQLVLRLNTNLSKKFNKLIKRLFDIIMVVLILVVISPLMLTIAIIIKKTTKSSIFFLHRRIGKNGEPFKCIKFQTMYPNSKAILRNMLESDPEIKKEWEINFKLKNDPRVTPIGKFLRATSLDELPQLFNVLLGNMSLVGPRPIILEEVERYQDSYYYYQLVLPGITGLWQVSGRSDVDYVNRVRLDEWYVKNWSIWYDIVILLKTVGVVIKRTGAY